MGILRCKRRLNNPNNLYYKLHVSSRRRKYWAQIRDSRRVFITICQSARCANNLTFHSPNVLNGFSLSCFPPLKLSEDMTKRKKARVYTEVFKLKVLRDFYSSGESAWSIARKWEIDPNSLYQWKRRWPIGSKELSLPAETLAKIPMPKPTPEKTAEELLQDRITALEHALALEKMRSRAFEKMIEIAESEEGISILKKDGAKQ